MYILTIYVFSYNFVKINIFLVDEKNISHKNIYF
jgi:hypothetical protein